MKALVVTQFGAADALKVIDLGVPEPGLRQVRVKVAGAAINQIDISTPERTADRQRAHT